MKNQFIRSISLNNSSQTQGQVTWCSPSNIALVKYWGKHGNQLPQNPSLSFTLKEAKTWTSIEYHTLGKNHEISIDFEFEGVKNELFEKKIYHYLQSITAYFPFLKQMHLSIKSKNSFPHSAGIASSASSMSALALCICTIEQKLKKAHNIETLSDEDFMQKSSYFARLASGSACRSIYGKAAVWGFSEDIQGSSDEYAIPFSDNLHPIFNGFRDDILIVSQSEKQVSSRAGHALMNHHPYAKTRYLHAHHNLSRLSKILQSGDLEEFIKITEEEALTLHALMMMSNPSFVLLKPNTLQLIEKIRDFRSQTKLPIAFTIDAGPNIHLLYPKEMSDKIRPFVTSELLPYCHKQHYISDEMGNGAMKLK